MKPRSFPAGTPKTHFSGLSLMSYFRRLSNVSLKSSTRDSTCLDLTTTSSTYASTCFADLVCQTCLNHALICCAGVFEPKGHCVEAEWAVGRDECCCSLVGFCHLYLMVTGVCVEETQGIVSCGGIDDLINSREGKGILWAGLIKVFEVDTQAPGFVLLWSHSQVR